jgi:hypothetical protein
LADWLVAQQTHMICLLVIWSLANKLGVFCKNTSFKNYKSYEEQHFYFHEKLELHAG